MLPDPRTGSVLRAWAIAACGILAAYALLGCSRGSDELRGTANAPRLITVGGAITETVFALGAGKRVVAVDTSSVFPPAVTSLPQVGYQRLLSAEGILAQAPDVLLVSAEAGPPAVLAQLRAAGIEVVVLPNAMTPDEAAARIVAIGKAIGTSGDADRLAATVRAGSHQRPGATKALVIYARGGGTLMVSGTETTASAMLELAGGTNVITGFTGFKALSAEVVIAAAPEVIVIPTRGLETIGGEAGLLAIPGISDTPAGKARRIVAMDDLLLLGFGPRLPQAIDELAARLAPASKSPGT